MKKKFRRETVNLRQRKSQHSDLVTPSEETMASQYTQSTNIGTQPTTTMDRLSTYKEIDLFEDVIAEESDNLFISP